MKAGLVISLVALAHLSGCAKNEPRACTPPDAAWRRPNFNQDAETIRNRVTLDRAGQLYWNGYAVSNGDFAKMLNAARLAPQADLYLEAEMGHLVEISTECGKKSAMHWAVTMPKVAA